MIGVVDQSKIKEGRNDPLRSTHAYAWWRQATGRPPLALASRDRSTWNGLWARRGCDAVTPGRAGSGGGRVTRTVARHSTSFALVMAGSTLVHLM